MISALHILQDALHAYQMKQANKDSDKEQTLIQNACDNTLQEAYIRFRQYTEHHLAEHAVRHCYRLLVRMHDDLYQNEPKSSMPLQVFASMIESFEIAYESYFPQESVPPRYAQETLRDEITLQLSRILDKLHKKKIPVSYLSEISSAINSLFVPGKLPELRFGHRHYLRIFLCALEEIALDNRKKDWEARFLLLLVNYNFNHMGIFNRWRELLDQELASIGSYAAREKMLKKREDNLRIHIPQPHYAYDSPRPALAVYMMDHITKSKQELYKEMEANPLLADEPILSTLNADEMTVYFHCAYKADLLKYPTKREAAKAFATYIRSKTGRTISYKSLEKFDRQALEPAAYSMRKKMKHMLTYLEKEFPF